jgi:hypothetical protein
MVGIDQDLSSGFDALHRPGMTATPLATSYQPSKSNGKCTGGRRSPEAIRSAGLVISAARDQHDGATRDQFLKRG